MPFVPSPVAIQLNFRMSLQQEQIENTLYVTNVGNINQSLVNTAAQIALSWWQQEYADLVSTNVTLREVVATSLASPNAAQGQAVAPPNTTGNKPLAMLPNNVAACVSFRTGFRGRSARGRNYISGLTDPDVVDNTLAPTTQTAIIAAYETFGALMNDDGYVWVVLSRYANNAPRPVAVTFPVLDAIFTDSTVDSIRRRLPGRGR